MRGDQPAPIKLDSARLADYAKLYGEPEQPPHPLQRVFVAKPGADLAVLLEKVSENRMSMHGHVAEDVVEDVGLGGVFERLAAAQPGGGRKTPRRQHLKKSIGRQKSADRCRVPTGLRLQPPVHLGQIRDRILTKPDHLEAVQIFLAGVFAQFGHPPTYQLSPDLMLLRRIRRPVLLDQIRGGDGQCRSFDCTSQDVSFRRGVWIRGLFEDKASSSVILTLPQ